MEKVSTIRAKESTINRLKDKRLYDRESLDSVINRVLDECIKK